MAMKKIILVCLMVLAVQVFVKSFVSADEVLESTGNIIPCKIETVYGGLIEYHKNGSLYLFSRTNDSLIYNDYVDVRTKLFKKDAITRFTGQIITKDMWGIILKGDNGNMDIPWFRVKFVGIYKP